MSVDSITDELTRSVVEEIERDLVNVSEELIRQIELKVPIDEGGLIGSLRVDPWQFTGRTFESTVRAEKDYAKYTDEGTGIYGPTGARITSHSGGPLVFYWRKAGQVVAFMSVAGTPAQNWFQEPMPDYFDRALERMSQ